MKRYSLFFILIFAVSSLWSYSFFRLGLPKPLFVTMDMGPGYSQSKPLEINENEQIAPSWTFSGFLIFVSKDENEGKFYNGIKASFLNSIGPEDWQRIVYKLVLKWKDNHGRVYKKDLAKGTFADPMIKKINKTSFFTDDSGKVRKYNFYFTLSDLNITFKMPLQPKTYQLYFEVSYPVEVWEGAGANRSRREIGTFRNKLQGIEILVKDITKPKVNLLKGLENEGNVTTGDPLSSQLAHLLLQLTDNDPNTNFKNVKIFIDNKEFPFILRNIERKYDENLEERCVANYTLNLPRTGNRMVLAPEDGSPLTYKIVAEDSAGNKIEYESQIENKDNDPPNIKFFIKNISGTVKKESYDPLPDLGEVNIDVIDFESRRPIYVTKVKDNPDRKIIIKTNKIKIKQNYRFNVNGFAIDNVDGEVPIYLNGKLLNKNGIYFIFSNYITQNAIFSARDKAGNERVVVIPIHIKKETFNIYNLQTEKK